MDLLTEDGLEDRAHPRRQVPLVDEVGEAQGGQGEDRPRVQGEVVVREIHGVDRGGRRARFDAEGSTRWIAEVADGFGNAPEHQVDADSGREQHAEPGHVGVFGPRVLAAESHVAVTAARDPQQEEQKGRHAEDVEPAEIRLHRVRHGPEDTVHLRREQDGPHDEGQDQKRRAEEDRRVRLQPEHPFQLLQHDDDLPPCRTDELSSAGRTATSPRRRRTRARAEK